MRVRVLYPRSPQPLGRVEIGPAGFTAVEVLTALLLVGVLAGFALPAWTRVRAGHRVSAARDAFALLHGRARWTAVQYGGIVRLHIDEELDQAWLRIDPGDLTLGREGWAPADAALDLAGRFGVSLQSNRRVLCFGPRGLPASGDGCEPPNATIVFRRGASVDSISISIAGRLLKR